MQTHFSAEQLAAPHIAESERIIRKCVHCGFCLATCPTYLELGNELDSPRGRIYLIKDMLESGRPASAETALHVDRCLSCLSCATTCPSGVDYMHLIDNARAYVERTYSRPFTDRALRALLAAILPYPNRFRIALAAARIVRPLAPLFHVLGGPFRRVGAMLELSTPLKTRAAPEAPHTRSAPLRGRVALLKGCAQSVLDPGINRAAESLLGRLGVEIVRPDGEGCCGSLVHHMGREDEARDFARRNIDSWMREIDNGLDAILITTSGCGTLVKDYGHLLANDPAYAAKAALIGSRTLDISEYLARLDLPAATSASIDVAYHAACSLQHGQKISFEPRSLLERAGYTLREIPEGHICCGSAGTYNILHPDIAGSLRDRKLKNIATTRASVIATGNIGCMTQLRSGTDVPIVHLVELLDWAYGGTKPQALNEKMSRTSP
jgi:glycolate oxidase iron-sulfur subunit